jgi:serine/threonine protein kinase
MAKKKIPLKESKQNLYDILEVSPKARPSVIQAAYRTLMQEYHPDKYSGDERIAKEINDAKEILLDDDKRAKYDSKRDNLEGVIIGNYKVLELIAEGGFGKTYKGEHLKRGYPVCIKHAHEISPQDEEILMQEAEAIWDLRHYGIPAVRDILTVDDGSFALIMSYIPGPTLEQVIEKAGPLDAEDVCWITERSLNVLKYLHYNGVVHGDVKPQNIIIQPESHNIVLVDYGLSAIRPKSSKSNKGYTPVFASPEQQSGGTILPESDFYSLGKTMIYALGGDLASNRVPQDVPDSVCKFMKSLLVHEVLSRPNWEKEDLIETFQNLRIKTFGRRHSGMKKIKGLGI